MSKIKDLINKVHLADAYEFVKQLPDKSIDCINTDVPYDVVAGGCGHSDLGKRIKRNGNEIAEQGIYNTFNMSILNEFIRVLKKINVYIWCSKNQIRDILNFFFDNCNNITYDILTWHKKNPSPLTNQVYLPDTEYCLSFREKGVIVKGGYENQRKYWEYSQVPFWITSLNVADKSIFEHLTIKPLHIVEQTVINTTNENDIILDCYGGSGTTGVACKNLNRNYILVDNNPKWVKVSQDRLNCITASGQIGFVLR
jgi:DNA modification methylase